MMYLTWIDISSKKVIKLKINGRNIYGAYSDDDSELNIESLLGCVLLNINPQIVRLKYWVIYKSEDNDIRISPIYDDMLEEVLTQKEIFKQPLDIRLIFRMFEL